MAPVSEYQVVVLAGGKSKDLFPLVSKDVPEALLPVANRPVLSYVLDLLEDSNLKDLMVVVAGDDAAVRISAWITEAYHDRLQVEVATVPEDAGTADALRVVSHRLIGDDILVVSGDLVCDVPLGAVAAAHRRQRAALTALLCTHPTADGSDTNTGSVKDKAKQPAASDIIGLDTSHQNLLYIASGAQLGKELRAQRTLLREAGQMEIRSDLVDAHLYAFNRVLLQEVLESMQKLRSVKQDLVPYIVRSQLRYEQVAADAQAKDAQNNHLQRVGWSEGLLPRFRCCAYLAGKGKYCARVNSIQAYGDINRDVAGDAIHLTGYTVSGHSNVIDTTAQLGVKTAVGPQCIIGEGSQLGDKCSVKRSVVGRHCRIGSNVKIINSVVMNHVTVEDSCLIQNSVVCSNVHLQERSTLKDCQVGCGFLVGAAAEHRAEALAKKEKA